MPKPAPSFNFLITKSAQDNPITVVVISAFKFSVCAMIDDDDIVCDKRRHASVIQVTVGWESSYALTLHYALDYAAPMLASF